jgi:type VI secretion system secreted protein VgrG
MAGEYKPNKLLDKTPYDDGRSEPDYPFVGGFSDDLGRSEIFYADPDKPDKAFHEKIGYAGNFASEEANGLRNELNIEVRSYTTGGHSHNSDGQHALYSQSNINQVAKQDLGLTAGGNTIKGSGEQELGGAAQSTYSVADGGNHYKAASGDVVYTADGDMNFGANGSFCIGTGGSRIESVGEEYYLYASGNIDIGGEEKLQVHSTGALSINTTATMNVISTGIMGIATQATMNVSSTGTMGINSQADVTIESASKITLKVGGSSIEITSGGIKLVGTRIDLN